MFLSLVTKPWFITLIVLIIALVGLSIYFINNIKREFKKLFRLRSKFHIEVRKIVNLIYNIYKPELLEPYTKVVIKKLSHAEKAELLVKINSVYKDLDQDNQDNIYIIETYNNMNKLMHDRDNLLESFNKNIKKFPQVIYAKIMNLPEYEYYSKR